MYRTFCTGVIPDREKKHDAEDGCVCSPESLTLVSDSGLISDIFAFYRRPDFGWKSAFDVAPTLYEFAGIDASKSLSERPTLPMIGVSFKRYLTGESLHAPRTQYGVELHNQAAWIDGEWKLRRLVTVFPQAGNAPWELFNLQRDPLETHNLAADYVDKVKILSSAYEAFAKQTMVLYAKGKLIDYVGIDSKTGRYLAVDPQTLQPVPAPLAIPLDTKSDQ